VLAGAIELATGFVERFLFLAPLRLEGRRELRDPVGGAIELLPPLFIGLLTIVRGGIKRRRQIREPAVRLFALRRRLFALVGGLLDGIVPGKFGRVRGERQFGNAGSEAVDLPAHLLGGLAAGSIDSLGGEPIPVRGGRGRELG
jgi:hypothetical protein